MPRGARSIATITAAVNATTAMPRVIGDMVIADVPSPISATSASAAIAPAATSRRRPNVTSCGVIAISPPATSWYTRASVP